MSRGFFVWFLASLFYAYQYILRVLPNVMVSDLESRFSIGVGSVGQFLGVYYLGYTLMHLPVGILLDRYGVKPILSVSLFLVVCSGVIPLIFADQWVYCLIGRFILGMSSVAAALGVFKVANLYYLEKKFATMSSISIIIGLMGAMYAGLPLYALFTDYGWNLTLSVIAVVGVFLALLLFLLAPKQKIAIASNDNNANLLINLLDLLKNRNVTMLAIFGGFMVAPLQGFADAWATAFLIEVYGMSESVASLLPSTIFIGMCIGMIVLSFAPQNRYYDYILICAVAICVSFVFLLTGQLNEAFISILFLIIGFACAYQILLTCKALNSVNQNVIGSTTAMTNMIVMFFGYLFHTGISQVINFYWDGSTADGVPIYSAALLIKALSLIPLGSLIGGLGIIWLKWMEHKKPLSPAKENVNVI